MTIPTIPELMGQQSNATCPRQIVAKFVWNLYFTRVCGAVVTVEFISQHIQACLYLICTFMAVIAIVNAVRLYIAIAMVNLFDRSVHRNHSYIYTIDYLIYIIFSSSMPSVLSIV
jgi:hypothetical protein